MPRNDTYELAIIHRNGHIDTHGYMTRKLIVDIIAVLSQIETAYEDTTRIAVREYLNMVRRT